MSEIIILHVTIAITSLVYATYVFVVPSLSKLKVSYGLIAGTFASGTILVISQPSHLLSVCETGLTYLAVVLASTVAARFRLAKEASKSK